jgi:uncharacterized protein YjbI with pentapeptide repeats
LFTGGISRLENEMSGTPFSSQEDFLEQAFESLDERSITVEDRHFENCPFLKCNFSGSTFKRCRFMDCTFEHCDLSNLQLRGATIRNVKFKDCKLIGTNWSNSSSIAHLDFERCVISYASFMGLDLRKSVIRNCLAREADFANANLSEVDCRGTDFAGTRFSKTNLTKADFRGATNYFIRPDGNTLKNAKFSLPEATLLLYGLGIDLEE